MATTIIRSIVNISIYLHFFLVKLFLWKPFVKKTLNPMREQRKVLQRILENNKNTEIGNKYGFSEVRSYEDYVDKVPVHTFEMLRGYIDKQLKTGNTHLTKNQPVMYARTSGTTDKPKLLPMFKDTIINYKRTQCISNYVQYSEANSMFDGKILAIASKAEEGELECRIPYGSLSGFIYKNIPLIIRSRYVLPYEVFDIEDYDEKYLIICVLASAQRNITTLASVNSSTLLKISQVINERFEEIVSIIESGVGDNSLNLSEKGKSILNEYISADKTRSDELKSIYVNKGYIRFKHIWLNLKAVVTWTQGNCSILIPRLKNQLDDGTKIFELGYFSSEFRGTVVLNPDSGSGVPVINENFYEFAEQDDWDKGRICFKTIEQLKTGKRYYIITTTPYGLYRYFINDIIEVTGKYNNTPEIKFVQKGIGVTNITGEKVYENHIIKALNSLKKEYGLDIKFFIFLAYPDELFYELLLESDPVHEIELSWLVDNELKNINIEYKAKRESGRLGKIKLNFVKNGTGEQFKKYCIRKGQRESQFKFNHIININECGFNFNEFIIH